MAERTERGEEEQAERDQQMQGEPLDEAAKIPPNTQQTVVTRDKGVKPTQDQRRDGHSQGK